MHLAEGIITEPIVLGAGAVIACGGVALGLRRLDDAQALRAAVLGSGFFVASLVHIPMFGVSVHLTLTGLLGVILGWAAFPAVLVGLVLQLVLFGFGGITTLGLNTCIMALPAVGVYYLRLLVLRTPGDGRDLWVCGVLGALSVGASALLLALVLLTAGEAFVAIAAALVVAHIPVMIIEALVTTATAGFLARACPDLLGGRMARDGASLALEEQLPCER